MPKKYEKNIAAIIFYYNFTKGKSTKFYYSFAQVVITFIMPFCLFNRIKL